MKNTKKLISQQSKNSKIKLKSEVREQKTNDKKSISNKT